MNTNLETWQENHERKLRLKSIFDEDRELVPCGECGNWFNQEDLNEFGDCEDCQSGYINDTEN